MEYFEIQKIKVDFEIQKIKVDFRN